jgi:peptidoglycan hydrolase-like protein with peptidoglycan-binding domain
MSVVSPTPGRSDDNTGQLPAPTSGASPDLATSSTTDAVPAGPPTAPTTALDEQRPRRRRTGPIIAAVVVAAGVGATALYLTAGDSSDTTSEPIQLRAVEAEQRDLVDYTDLDGTMRYGSITSVTTATDGTIIAVADDGTLLERGAIAYEIDGAPVVVFYGTTPLYRTLTEGDEGDDVEVLEANLASLGYHTELDDNDDEIDRGFVVDGVFDAATTDAVLAWQADIGVEETGTVQPGSIIVTAGPSLVSNVAVETASIVRAGSPIMDLNVTASVDATYSNHAGDLELEAASGPVTSGQVLYVVDDLPITAVVTDETLDRNLFDGVEDGDDIEAVERMLADLGYDADGDLEIDDRFDEFTTEAIEDWQDDLQDSWDDVEVDGQLSLDDIIVIEPGTTIGTVTDRQGDDIATGSELFTATVVDGNRIVDTSIEVADQAKLTEGATVDIEFPDGSATTGLVTEVATSSTKDQTDPNAEAELAVEITLDSIPDSAAGFNELDVVVKLVDELAQGATVVPASALLTTADGGYAVEVVNGVTDSATDTGQATTQYVAVETGMFVDGFVEVTGIAPGTAVVVPS